MELHNILFHRLTIRKQCSQVFIKIISRVGNQDTVIFARAHLVGLNFFNSWCMNSDNRYFFLYSPLHSLESRGPSQVVCRIFDRPNDIGGGRDFFLRFSITTDQVSLIVPYEICQTFPAFNAPFLVDPQSPGHRRPPDRSQIDKIFPSLLFLGVPVKTIDIACIDPAFFSRLGP